MTESARVLLSVHDDTGEPSPFCVQRLVGDGAVAYDWSDSGVAEIAVAPGDVRLRITRGIHYDAVDVELHVQPGQTISHTVTLRRRFDLRIGWFGGESHMHVLHDRRDKPATFADGARMAAAEGLDYIQLAYGWDESFEWLAPAELERRCRDASNRFVTVGWNVEAPKGYMTEDHGGRDGNLHCFGHGWTVGLKDHSLIQNIIEKSTSYRVINEVHRQGGIVGCAHPARFWFHKGNFVSNWPSELPFDFVAGSAYDTIDILNDSPLLFYQSERLWHTLLNMGYRASATGNSDGAIGAGTRPGRFRTYTKLDGPFSWEKLIDGMRAGRNVATSGPFVVFEVDGEDPGAEFPADGRVRRATIEAWSGPLPGESLVAVQLVRNGEVVRAWDLHSHNARHWETSLDLSDAEFAWYCVRIVVSRSRDWRSVALWGENLCELAVANAVWFLPDGFQRPRPQPATVHITVTDDAGQPLAATVTVLDEDRPIATHEVDKSGQGTITAPATATLRFAAPGHETATHGIYLDCPELFEYSRNIGTVWPSFYSPETYVELRRRLGNIRMSVSLRRMMQ